MESRPLRSYQKGGVSAVRAQERVRISPGTKGQNPSGGDRDANLVDSPRQDRHLNT